MKLIQQQVNDQIEYWQENAVDTTTISDQSVEAINGGAWIGIYIVIVIL